MGGKKVESCGRCAMSSTAGLLDETDPFEGERIELSDSEARAVSPAAWLSGVTARLDALVTEFTYGR